MFDIAIRCRICQFKNADSPKSIILPKQKSFTKKKKKSLNTLSAPENGSVQNAVALVFKKKSKAEREVVVKH